MVLELIEQADGLIEGFRPGVMERLGLGPGLPRAQSTPLGRVTGWGQDGPLSQVAGHDLNYISVTGALHAMGRVGQPPTPPLNVLGDYAGGSLSSGFSRASSKRAAPGAQVVDAAMVDGVASIMTVTMGLHAAGMLDKARGTNLLDTGAPFYEVYACADGKYVSVGPIEGKFYRLLLEQLGLQDHPQLQAQMDRAQWPAAKQILAAKFRERTRDEWALLLSPLDVCVAPVLDFDEAPNHPHVKARGTFVELDGVTHPAPGPRFRARPLRGRPARCADHRQRDRRAATGCPTRASRRCARRLSSDAGQQRHALTPAHCSLQLSACARRASKRRRGNWQI